MEDKEICDFINKMMSDDTKIPESIDVRKIMEEAKKIKFTIPEEGFVMTIKKESD